MNAKGVFPLISEAQEDLEHTENALRESDEKFHQLADNINDVFWIRSPDMREVHYVSPAFEQMWGVPVGTHYSNPQQWADFILPEDRERVLAGFAGLTRDSSSIDLEYRIVRPDGQVRWVRSRGFQVRDAQNTLIRLTGIVTDVTEARLVADALRASLDEFRTLAEAMPQIVWITRPDGSNVYINKQWLDYTGQTVEESSGQGWNQPFHPDDQQRALHAWRHATETLGTYSIECRLRRADGVYRWWLIRGVPVLDASGTILKWFGTCTDIHDLKMAALEIRRTNRALKMLSACSEALSRAESELQLLNDVCRIAVKNGGYRMAWVGYAQNDEARSVTPVAHAGVEDGFLSEIKVSWNENEPQGQGPAGQVIRAGRAVVCEDLALEPRTAHWLPLAQRRGYSGTICLPLRDAAGTFGLVVLYTGVIKQTSAEELALLQEMADNIAFGIGNLRSRSEARRLQAAVVKVAAAVSATTSVEFFEQLAGNMAEALEAQGGFVTQLLPGEPLTGRTIAAVVDGKVVDNFTYPVNGTPCENLLTSDACVIAKQVTEQFTGAPMLAALGAQGYVGRRLDSSSGQPLGHLFVVFREPLKEVGFISSTLQIFAARAAAELERRQTDVQVREQAALLDVAQEAIQVTDLEGKIIYWNKGAERTYGWTAADALDRESLGLLYKDPAAFQSARAELLDKGEWQGEMVKRTNDGRDLTVAAHWTLVRDAQGRAKAVLAIDTDVTGKKTLETQLMVSDRMASVGTLAAGVAHEINNPLAAVMGNLDYIADSLERMAPGDMAAMSPGMLDAWLSEEIKGPLDDAREAAQRVRFIVRDLKIFSRSPNDEERGHVNVEAIMESSLRMAWNEIRHRARLVKLYGRVPVVEANEARLGQVFLNLVVNAAQALPDGQAEHNEIRVATRLEGNRVIIEVSDTGAGIPPEIIGRIFDAFFTTKAVGVGTGLGLAICQRIVTDMGGALTVQSKVGEGTTFRVSVPVGRKQDGDTVATAESVAPAGRRGRILVVDDEELVVRSVKRILSTEHDVVATVSAAAALALCAGGERFDLILCDLMMPDMTGMDLHHELSRVAPEQADKMVFVTGGAFTEKARRFLAETPRQHLEKPFHSAKLRAIVQRYLR